MFSVFSAMYMYSVLIFPQKEAPLLLSLIVGPQYFHNLLKMLRGSVPWFPYLVSDSRPPAYCRPVSLGLWWCPWSARTCSSVPDCCPVLCSRPVLGCCPVLCSRPGPGCRSALNYRHDCSFPLFRYSRLVGNYRLLENSRLSGNSRLLENSRLGPGYHFYVCNRSTRL